MLILIGLGLGQLDDITVGGLRRIRAARHVYLEHYTAILGTSLDALRQFTERPDIQLADRESVEQHADRLLIDQALDDDVALLVVGDPLAATTHCDLMLRARQRGVRVDVLHNASIVSAVACCGLQLYRFGETISIPFWENADDESGSGGSCWQPDSFLDRIEANYSRDLHTLCLLDIKVKEPNLRQLARGRTVYDQEARFMTASVAARQLMEALRKRRKVSFDAQSMVIALARVGQEDERLLSCSLADMESCGEQVLGSKPMHSLVVPARELHPLEEEFVESFRLSSSPSAESTLE